MKNRRSKRRDRGFSLIELLLILTISAVLLSGLMERLSSRESPRVGWERQKEMSQILRAARSKLDGARPPEISFDEKGERRR